MEVPEASVSDPAYIEKKREELKIFFKDSKFPEDVINKVIENELKPLTEDPRPYIAASEPGEVKSEYEVMTGQPFTDLGDFTRPLTTEEIKEMLKGNPILAEKARQIQIMGKADCKKKHTAIPLNEIHLKNYNEMREELDSAEGDKEKVNKLKYENMQSLMNSVSDYNAKCVKDAAKPSEEDSESEDSQDSDEKEFEAIEKVVSQYTDKSYETRFQETKDMLQKMADQYDDPNSPPEITNKPAKLKITKNSILKESSVHLIKGQRRRTVFEEVKETYSINKAMNITLKDNPVTPDLSGELKNKHENLENAKKEGKTDDIGAVFPTSMEAKLIDTQKALREINTLLNNSTVPDKRAAIEDTPKLEIKLEEINNSDIEVIQEERENKVQHQNIAQKFDEKMEQTLQSALVDIFEISNNDNRDNKEMEFKEMKNLAHNIVEGAENLSTLIREDITNKLNSMNELLNDVNKALENSRKSNLVYQKLKEEGSIMKHDREFKVGTVTVTEVTDEEQESTGKSKENPENQHDISDTQIDDIHTAIGKLNTEIQNHEYRIKQSKERYEQRNKECKSFVTEIDEILLKSKEILHPKAASSITETTKVDLDESNDRSVQKTGEGTNEKAEKVRKELWDVDLSCMQDETNKKLSDFDIEQKKRNARIDNLLFDIKDKMKDNQDVLRLANNLLRREETKKKGLKEKNDITDVFSTEEDTNAQGDNIKLSENRESDRKVPSLSKVPPAEGEIHGNQFYFVQNDRPYLELHSHEARSETHNIILSYPSVCLSQPLFPVTTGNM